MKAHAAALAGYEAELLKFRAFLSYLDLLRKVKE